MTDSIHSYVRQRQASKSARAKRRPKLEVELTANVEHLGSAGQRVQVAPGRMRNHLFPSKLALYVLGGRTMHLDGSLSQSPSMTSHSAASGETSSSSPANAATQLQTQAQLENIGLLTFTRRTSSQDTLHGSVTPQNILSALQQLGVPLTQIEGEWQGEKSHDDGIDNGKIKKLGEYVCEWCLAGVQGDMIETDSLSPLMLLHSIQLI